MNTREAVVVLYYNKIRITRRCIQSILDAGFAPPQVYCFDNGSEPEVFAELQRDFLLVNHSRSEENHGFSGGFNRALRWTFSHGHNAALFCTNDTLVYPGALERCSQKAKETGAGMVAPCITYLSHPNEIDSIGAYFDPGNCTIHHYHERNLPDLLIPGKNYIPGTALWIHEDTFTALGGTDESYHTYWEDVDMCFRAHQKEIPLARCYEARLSHGVGQTCHKRPLYTTFYFQRNRIRFCKRFLSGEVLDNALKLIHRELLALRERWEEKNDQKRLSYFDLLQKEISLPRSQSSFLLNTILNDSNPGEIF